MRRLIALSVLAVAVASGCTSRLATNSSTPKTRTYTQNVQPVTSDKRCQECHMKNKGQTFAIGTYAQDIKKKSSIQIMVRTNANPAYDSENGFLTAEQIKDVEDWVAAGAPNDDTPF